MDLSRQSMPEAPRSKIARALSSPHVADPRGCHAYRYWPASGFPPAPFVFGELVPINGSEHGWFENRGEMCTLLAFVDDATSGLMRLRFVASEWVFDYCRATRDYLETYDKPVAYYSDKPASSG
jgi:hypothetical protein